MRAKIVALISFIAVILSFMLFCAVFFYNIYDLSFYKQEYIKYNITKFSAESLVYETNNIFGFFKGTAALDSDYFNKDEILHLNDVRILIHKLFILFFISLCSSLILTCMLYKESRKRFSKNIAKSIFYSGIIGLFTIFFGFLFFKFFGFDFIFTKFHELFFIGNYSFNPAASNMKYMFPDGFFFDMSYRILFFYLMFSIFVSLFGLFFIMRKKSMKSGRNNF